jgi:ATP-dependent helicase/nuclease subunit B
VRVHFLLGPAGSGKTWRCLADIRTELKRSPDGPPLLLLAPKQATFQLERQLLDDASLAGYTRLQIVSFDRLANWLLETFATVPELLDDEGRVMVLRALLAREHASLRVFRATARLPGFARQLSQLLREFQRHQLTPVKLARLAARCAENAPLHDKLHDLHHLLRAYHEWLEQSEIRDADQLLDHVTEQLRESLFPIPHSPFPIAGLWLDGFAEMTPQELDLLCAVLPFCRTATLAFCLDPHAADSKSWLSLWSGIRRTYGDCHTRVKALPTSEVTVEELPRTPAHSRFRDSATLAHLEANWTAPSPSRPVGRDSVEPQLERSEASAASISGSTTPNHDAPPQTTDPIPHPLRLTLCPNPEAEAVAAAREILRHVRSGGRYRDCAVILRTLDHHHVPLRRVFTRYGIPFFLDRREPVTHHPLAELTRFALRTLAYGWQPDDLFGALKTGLTHDRDADIDWLENLALAHGWSGARWLEPLQVPDPKFNLPRAETLRAKLTAPFRKLAAQLVADASLPRASVLDCGGPPPLSDTHDSRERQRTGALQNLAEPRPPFSNTEADLSPAAHSALRTPHSAFVSGSQLAAALRAFWETLHIETRLAAWDDALARESDSPNLAPPLHATVLRQMHAWLENLERAFPDTAPALPLRDWLPILEAGLSSLSVGVIPPALDQVLIGTIDRSRNPELHLALVLGLNEGQFPAPPTPPVLLTDAERDLLSLHDTRLGLDPRAQIAHERYFAYIACTRSRARLVLSCSAADQDGKPLHPSPILAHIQQLFPGLELEKLPTTQDWRDAEHADELLEPILTGMRNAEAAEPRASVLECGSSPRLSEDDQSQSHQPADPDSPFPIPHSLLPVLARYRELTAARALTTLSPNAVAALYQNELATSVSKLEQFAECPFKFFVAAGLRAQERKEFELDHRERGSFIHRLLDEFHLRVTASQRRWRDLSPADASALAARIGEDLLASPEFTIFGADESRRFAARTLIASAERLLAALVGWMPHYAFDPVAVELAFGLGPNPPLPALRLALADGNSLSLRGRIDRVDLTRDPLTGATLAVVVDYKSSPKKLEPNKIAAGLQLQLLTYLNVLRARQRTECGMRNAECGMENPSKPTAPDPRASVLDCGGPPPLSDAHDPRERQRTGALQNLAALRPPLATPQPDQSPTADSPFPIPHSPFPPLVPAGVFYIPLHGAAAATGSRAEILAEDEATRRTTYQHAGRFDFARRPALDDRANAQPSGQFRYTLNKDGALSKRPGDALPTAEFTDLLTQVEANLRRLGEAIFAGEVTVAPVRLSASEKACDRCDYRPICRFDPWTQPYRSLPKPGARTPTSAADAQQDMRT